LFDCVEQKGKSQTAGPLSLVQLQHSPGLKVHQTPLCARSSKQLVQRIAFS